MTAAGNVSNIAARLAEEHAMARTDALREAVVEAIAQHGRGMTVAQVVGVLAVLQMEIAAEWKVRG